MGTVKLRMCEALPKTLFFRDRCREQGLSPPISECDEIHTLATSISDRAIDCRNRGRIEERRARLSGIVRKCFTIACELLETQGSEDLRYGQGPPRTRFAS
jgi:hypothetical protein